MRYCYLATTTMLSFAAITAITAASAADLAPMPVKAKPIIDVPFFLVNDNRVTYSYIFSGTDPGAFTVRPNGTVDGKTGKQAYSFSHFDVWAYGTNFFTISMFKSGHNDPASPCTNAGTIFGTPANCAGATEIYGLVRSTFGWNELQHQGLQHRASAQHLVRGRRRRQFGKYLPGPGQARLRR